ncbi:XisI protein [Dolichospermum sp. ST_con]|nr:XisI protein [Dolichospermum sp. ST_con]MDD1418211.1 XisI protein [Dolichospermum sp. ST_sed1]MDD1424013.1 XisI protein [Dolichospermum sp. ST_sed9]MDD1430449.1 XisI protein [Dolichospermum sp. ST_sed6]MDD1437189.1 XisI protein [Dolichospermum sp. ST_sed10]MDD1439805.1 XisI protein [Dolichospermum sp. ST_sed3]MDD1446774.1 XisI protein [Dolichospermum sp. ST_sed8]MDD1454961.1 XisI protein [Dolichospermum sp. ST_sed7]MDD1460790.1 XisI protein [Dolichospermum sp. ST_sed2]MDD1469497.1 XisI 
MDKLEKYRNYIQSILQEYSQYQPSYGDVELQLMIDREHDHYQLMTVGWNGEKRIHGIMLHLDIKNNKIWIQHNGTERGITQDLLALGVPKEDIVLAFHSPTRRKYTDFAVS